MLALLLFFLCRLFFLAYNADYFSESSFSQLLAVFWGGLIFDLAGLSYLLFPYVILQTIPVPFKLNKRYQRAVRWLFVVPLSVGVLANLADAVYFPITLKRTTWLLFEQFSHESNLIRLTGYFLVEYWYATLLFMFLVWLIFFTDKKLQITERQNLKGWKFYLTESLVFLILTVNMVAAIRGGYSRSVRPMTLSNAVKYTSSPKQRALVLNTPFTMIRTMGVEPLNEVRYFSTEDQQKIFSALHIPKAGSDSLFMKKNVVLFILESFGREHVGALNRHIPGYQGFTPFLDSLIGESYTFRYAFANGQKSICGMTSNITSLPTFETPFVLSNYSGNEVAGLAKTLKRTGYRTAFFHGAANGSMGFDAFAKQSGFDRYFGRDEYNNDADYDGMWGIWDEPFMQYFARQMDQMQEPFFTSFFSLSSHHPFRIPEQYVGVFPEGKLPIQQTIAYTDHALRQFFKQAKKMPWFKNTLFIITADHASTYNENSLKEYKTLPGVFSVPIVLYDPSSDRLRGFDDSTVVQQIDIMPTVLNYLNYPDDYVAFGTDMLNRKEPHFAIDYESGYYVLFQDDYVLRYDGENVEGLYDYRKDPHLLTKLEQQEPERLNRMLTLMQAFLQEHNRRMKQDELSVK